MSSSLSPIKHNDHSNKPKDASNYFRSFKRIHCYLPPLFFPQKAVQIKQCQENIQKADEMLSTGEFNSHLNYY